MISGYQGIVVHCVGLNELQVIQNGLIGVNEQGKIVFLRDLDTYVQEKDLEPMVVHDFHSHLLIPGFIDAHTHAPQYSYLGIGMHLPLLEWLDTYTFPKEAKFHNLPYARAMYQQAVQNHLTNGTTTCSYFATIHIEATKALVDVVHNLGQRGFIGHVNMDRNAPDQLRQETDESLASTRVFVSYCQEHDNQGLITPVITPRFVPSTTSDLMHGLASLARSVDPPLPIQSHLAESQAEIDWVRALHPDNHSYTHVYDTHRLLHTRAYMAHGIWCSRQERALLKARGTGIIHCPNSNFNLNSGILNVRRLLQEGLKVGLGTDVCGGSSTSMLDAIRQAIIASKLVQAGHGSSPVGDVEPDLNYPALSYTEAFYLATMGSATCLGLDQVVGNFEVGKEFDALAIQLHHPGTPIHPHPEESVHELFQRFLFVADDRHITHVFVRGQAVKGHVV